MCLQCVWILTQPYPSINILSKQIHDVLRTIDSSLSQSERTSMAHGFKQWLVDQCDGPTEPCRRKEGAELEIKTILELIRFGCRAMSSLRPRTENVYKPHDHFSNHVLQDECCTFLPNRAIELLVFGLHATWEVSDLLFSKHLIEVETAINILSDAIHIDFCNVASQVHFSSP